jgi:tetratricopeptide (TPR) repeat protein
MRLPPAAFFLILAFTLGPMAQAQSAEDYRRQASRLIDGYQFQEALELLERSRLEYPEDIELLLELAGLHRKLGLAGRAGELLQKARALAPANSAVPRMQGEARLDRGDLKSAAAFFREALSLDPWDSHSQYLLAFVLFISGRESQAFEHAGLAVDLDPANLRARRLLALLLNVRGENREAQATLKAGLRASPLDGQLLFQISELQRATGQLVEAMESLERAVEQDPENPVFHASLAGVYGRLKLEDLAKESEKTASRLRLAFDHYIEALALSRKNRARAAIDLLRPAVTDNPEFVTGRLLLADLLHKTGDRAGAAEVYLQVLEQQPKRPEARERSAWIRVEQGDLDTAIRLLSEPGYETDNLALVAAYRYLVQEDWTAARQQLQQVEARYPLDARILKLIAACLLKEDRAEEAIGYLDKAQALVPGDLEIARQKEELEFKEALRLVEAHRWRQAIAAFTRLIESNPARSEYFLRRAYCRERTGDLVEAVKDYQRGLVIDPDSDWARHNLAASLFLLSRHREAARQWEDLTQRHPANGEHFAWLGQAYSRAGRDDDAAKAFERALDLGVTTPAVLYDAGITLLRKKELERGWHLIRRAAEQGYRPAIDLRERAGGRVLELSESPRFSKPGE